MWKRAFWCAFFKDLHRILVAYKNGKTFGSHSHVICNQWAFIRRNSYWWHITWLWSCVAWSNDTLVLCLPAIVLIPVECRSFEWKCRNWFLDEQQFIWKFLTFCRHLTCFSNFVSFVLPWWIRVTRGKTVLVIKALWMQEMCRNNKASDFLKTTHRQSWFFQT